MNVVLILADQHRADCMGPAGNQEVTTPSLDRMAADGIVYDRCYCAFPVCTPSRYSLLSGLPVHEHSGWSNRSTLAPTVETFVRTLRSAGYDTTAVGKMHFTPTYLDVGFDEMRLCEQDGEGRWDDDYHRYLMQHGLIDRIDLMDQRKEFREHAPDEYWRSFGAMASNLPEEHHSTSWIGRQAVDAVSRFRPGGSSFLMVGFVKPHHPFDPPAEWLEGYDPSRLTIPDGWTESPLPADLAWSSGYFPHTNLTPDALRRVMAHYYATISHTDDWIGRILDTLQASGAYDDTLVVYTSDHGEYLGHHHLLLKGGPLYEPLVRVPLLVKPAGSGTGAPQLPDPKAMYSNTDLGSMILSAADLAEPPPGREYVFAHAPSRGADHAAAMVRSQRYKLMRGPVESMFFDLRLDPQELNNSIRLPEYQAVVAAHEEALSEFEGGTPVSPDPFVDLDAPTIEPAHGNEPTRRQVVDYFRSAMGTH